jgi:pimeloyl-ACP methyl ester carboxylesterase
MARWIAPAVARTTRICVYDRAGHGRSETAPGKNADAARDLHVMLQRRHIPGPYVIAGHSLGGAFALSYTDRYPADVAGLALLDSMHPQQTNAFAGMDPLLALVPTLARTGLGRLLFDPKYGEPVAQAREFARDVAAMPAELSRAAKLTSLGNRPLAVVTAGKGYQPGWLGHQRELAELSSNTHQVIVAGSTHQSLIDDRADAARSSQAIRDVVHAVRSSGGR